MKIWPALLLMLTLSACDDCNTRVDPDSTDSLGQLLSQARYMRLRPGLCVGYFWANQGAGDNRTGGAVVFTVPCDVLVEKP